MTIQWKGIPASTGIAIGPLWIYQPASLEVPRYPITDIAGESKRIETALQDTLKELQELYMQARLQVSDADADIFNAHQLFLQDPEWIAAIHTHISAGINAEAAVNDSAQSFIEMLSSLDDPYFRERAQDVRAVANQLIQNLLGKNAVNENLPPFQSIVIADELTPADTIRFNKSRLLGLVTSQGGPTSHAAILARSLGIPAVVSMPFDRSAISTHTQAVLDCSSGVLVIDPDPAFLEAMQRNQQILSDQSTNQLAAAINSAITLDGRRVEVVANIGSLADAVTALTFGADGVGLFRTEFLYLANDRLITENEQIQIYQSVFDVMGDRPVVVRTLDIGGDKEVAYLGLKPEANPFLGWRGVRMISERPDLLKDQFRALLLAGINADLRIMLPMVSNIHEVIQARQILEQVRSDLINQEQPFARRVQFGIMVEVPSTALIAEQFAPLVDFFSIGTNDLTQYTLAVDRTNSRVASLASPYHPAVLRLIHHTIQAAHAAGKWVGLCGEMAGETLAVPVLLGLGLDEFSAASPSIPGIKETIRKYRGIDCQKLAEDLLSFADSETVIAHLKAFCND